MAGEVAVPKRLPESLGENATDLPVLSALSVEGRNQLAIRTEADVACVTGLLGRERLEELGGLLVE